MTGPRPTSASWKLFRLALEHRNADACAECIEDMAAAGYPQIAEEMTQLFIDSGLSRVIRLDDKEK